jgi:hypothetical protein
MISTLFLCARASSYISQSNSTSQTHLPPSHSRKVIPLKMASTTYRPRHIAPTTAADSEARTRTISKTVDVTVRYHHNHQFTWNKLCLITTQTQLLQTLTDTRHYTSDEVQPQPRWPAAINLQLEVTEGKGGDYMNYPCR